MEGKNWRRGPALGTNVAKLFLRNNLERLATS
jgi:hypothetical protein